MPDQMEGTFFCVLTAVYLNIKVNIERDHFVVSENKVCRKQF